MPSKKDAFLSFTRRDFLKGMGTAAVSTATAGARAISEELEKVNRETRYGPEAVDIELQINGKSHALKVPPQTTLLEALRDHLPLTGAKEVCGRGSCGACTVLYDGKPVYACMKLAIEAQGIPVTTVEGLADNERLSSIQQAFVDEDGLQCGYCTSGFLLTLDAMLKETPKPSEAHVRKAVSGNLCRCGSYPRIFSAALRAAGVTSESKTEVIFWGNGQKLA